MRQDLLGGVVVLHHDGYKSASPLSGKPLYQSLPETSLETRPVELNLIPYYAWANRGQSRMEVWIPLQ